MRKALNAAGYIFVAALFALALTAAARSEVPSEKPSQFIWQAADGTYTNLPLTHGDVKQWAPSRDRVTPVQRQPAIHDWHNAAPNVHRHSEDTRNSEDSCRQVYVDSTSRRGGGATVCGAERAVIREQRVRQRGSLVTSTDTVLEVDGREVMRIRGRRAQHDPGRTVVE